MSKDEKPKGLKTLIVKHHNRHLLQPCDNCGCRRYNPCTCTRKEGKLED